jgi:hypothetical protein
MKISVLFQRLEALSMLVATLYFYHEVHGNWIVFVILWFAFDLSMLGYVLGPKVGAYAYNLGHSFMLPSLLLVLGTATHSRSLVQVVLIWFAHITLDRLLGYGLKETEGFTHTHLGLIGPDMKKQ